MVNLSILINTVYSYDNSTLDTVFSVGLQGIRREDANRVEEIVLKTLETVAV